MIRAILFALAVASAPLAARAESVYVTDVLVVLLRAGAAPDTATVKQLTSGAALEVQERRGAYARVRDAQGVAGWVEARYLVADPPASARLAALQSELDQARARLAELERRSSDPAASPSTPAPAPVPDPEAPWGAILWLGISSAMLVAGFLAGVYWLRARNRRRLGGMTINIRNL